MPTFYGFYDQKMLIIASIHDIDKHGWISISKVKICCVDLDCDLYNKLWSFQQKKPYFWLEQLGLNLHIECRYHHRQSCRQEREWRRTNRIELYRIFQEKNNIQGNSIVYIYIWNCALQLSSHKITHAGDRRHLHLTNNSHCIHTIHAVCFINAEIMFWLIFDRYWSLYVSVE